MANRRKYVVVGVPQINSNNLFVGRLIPAPKSLGDISVPGS
jgi:hypothetical protein